MDKHSSSVVSAPYNVFKQTGSANWSVRFSIPGQGQIRKSLGTRDRHEAEKLAQRFYYESLLKAESGLNVRAKSISRIIQDYIAHMEARVAQARLPKNVAVQNTAILTRYVDGFFGEHNPNFISSKSVDAYLSWRSDYWISGPGKDIQFITYERNGKTITSPITQKKRVRPTPATLNRERAALNGFFQFCFDSQYIKSIPEIRTAKVGYTARPGFSCEEYKRLREYAFAQFTEDNLNPAVKYDRILFSCYIQTIAMTGMRPTEVKNMKWGDVLGLKFNDKGRPYAHDVHLRVYGKAKSRELIPHREVKDAIVWLYRTYQELASFSPDRNDPLFLHQDKTPFKSFSGQFTRALEACDLVRDYRGVKRTPYSLRHFYITEQLKNGVDAYILARNTGTSVQMLEAHYDHNTNEKYKDMLRPKRS
ncbi:site-specific integrase [Gluconobacter sphaericus]|uniref:tyrosine-type recombinase/integrase n=1 Tax=Gluconobacter sphaericus TaxID=574987 RepID=UPI0011450067|nr:site-specific integrase [Gluconobacter sphaericus]MBF0885089.1 site-specific integrase [Gluconobacter sphaericus]